MTDIGTILGADGTSPDVWVTRILLLLTPLTASVVTIVKVIQGRDEGRANSQALATRLDKVEKVQTEHHEANTARLDTIESKLDGKV